MLERYICTQVKFVMRIDRFYEFCCISTAPSLPQKLPPRSILEDEMRAPGKIISCVKLT